MLNQCLNADNLQKSGWPNDPICPFCRANPETGLHILLCYPFAQQVWSRVFIKSGLTPSNLPASATSLLGWWCSLHHGLDRSARRRWNTTITLVWWTLWKERNARIFNNSHTAADPTLSSLESSILSLIGCSLHWSFSCSTACPKTQRT